MNKEWDPNGVGIANGNYFGFPHSSSESDLVLLSIPWDVTTSYGQGTAQGPKAILEESVQLDFFHFQVPQAWTKKIGTLPTDPWIRDTSSKNQAKARSIIDALEHGKKPNPTALAEVNRDCSLLMEKVQEQCAHWLTKGKKVGLVGGDHSTPLGLMKALDEHHSDWGILQIDAHADLRVAYEGFEYSHASIMHNALKECSFSKLVQVGIRDISPEEFERTQKDDRIVLFSNSALKQSILSGSQFWTDWCSTIVSALPDKVYISFDIDGLDPSLCPNTGTPVPGGLSFEMIVLLLDEILKQGKEIIGFDLVEVAPGTENTWDANVGARILYELAVRTA